MEKHTRALGLAAALTASAVLATSALVAQGGAGAKTKAIPSKASREAKIALDVLVTGVPGSARLAGFASFLRKHFRKVGTHSYSDFTAAAADAYDVVVLDAETTSAGSSGLPRPPKLDSGYARATVLVSAARATLARRFGIKTGWASASLDAWAHGVESTHEIFQRPLPVHFSWKRIATPANYRRFYGGRALPLKMRMWRVQTLGSKSGRRVKPGVVGGSWGYANGPDCEAIASGVNAKGPRHTALGRHGPFFQWGFSAAPSWLTRSGQRAFVNAICYIAKFDRQAPRIRNMSRVPVRGDLLDQAVYLRGWEKDFEKCLKEFAAMDEAPQRGCKQMPPIRSTYRRGVMRRIPEPWRGRFDVSSRGLRDLLRTVEKDLPFVTYRSGWLIDTEARAIGFGNQDPALLAACIERLEKGEDVERARRVLHRYTDKRFKEPAAWRRWFDASKDELFFSDWGGYRFYSRRTSDTSLRSQVSKRKADSEPSAVAPVAIDAFVIERAGKRATIAVRMRVADGWHTYAEAPESSAYPVTKLIAKDCAGLSFAGEWRKPAGMPSPDEPELSIYEGSVVFLRDVVLGDGFVEGSKLAIKVTWQCCNDSMCMPPDETDVRVDFGAR